jgi:hypothetical protein
VCEFGIKAYYTLPSNKSSDTAYTQGKNADVSSFRTISGYHRTVRITCGHHASEVCGPVGWSMVNGTKQMQSGINMASTLLPSDSANSVTLSTSSQPVKLGRNATMAMATLIYSASQDIHPVDQLANPEREIECQRLNSDALQQTQVDDQTRERLRSVLLRYIRIVTTDPYDLGLTNLLAHKIHTADAPSVREALRRHPVIHLQVIDDQVRELLVRGIIAPSSSDWASQVCLVRKADNSFRFAIDYRRLNQIFRHDSHPLPKRLLLGHDV